mgnify:CR=1 FL=1
MKYTITVTHKNKAPEAFDTDDTSLEDALKSAAMLACCFPDSDVRID